MLRLSSLASRALVQPAGDDSEDEDEKYDKRETKGEFLPFLHAVDDDTLVI
jgi:hypothetical protein